MDLKARLDQIHVRLLAGSRTASLDLFREAAGPLGGFLRNEFKRLSDDEIHDLANDAILEYLGDPSICDPGKSSLWSFLCTIAKRDAIDLTRKQARDHALLQKRVETDVEFWASRSKDTSDGENAIDARRIMRLHGGRLVTNQAEANVLVLILNEEKRTEAFAQALGVDPSAAEVDQIVKQAKDRMLLRLKRLRNDL
ncbi:sigma factor [Bosea sp. NPDC055353]